MLRFLNTFIQPSLAGTPADQARIAPLLEWWHLACTGLTVTITGVSSPLLSLATPCLQAKLSAWASCIAGNQLARLDGGWWWP
jgi:hypothetical protein